ncbi:hypothetical protein Hanom_Chr02g00111141 [Helianthus anomalus]
MLHFSIYLTCYDQVCYLMSSLLHAIVSSGSTRLTRFTTAMGCSLVSPTVLDSLLGA